MNNYNCISYLKMDEPHHQINFLKILKNLSNPRAVTLPEELSEDSDGLGLDDDITGLESGGECIESWILDIRRRDELFSSIHKIH